MLKAPELLLPAGSLDKMHAAFDFGADAVYAGQPRYSLRVRNNDFSTLQALQEGIDGAHARGKQFFVASNIFAHNAKLKTYLRDMEPVIAMKPDALIMADPGLIMMVRDKWPEVPVHLSVQANAVNWADVKFWHRMGLTRVILSRELSLDEIEEIRQQCPEMELEVFVHGALCIAYSGRCLLSGYFNHRDPNQGTCTNSCRWDYKVRHAQEDATGDFAQVIPLRFNKALQEAEQRPFSSLHQQPRHPLADQAYLIEEAERPGQLMPIMEDEHGTYIMNSKDLRAVEHIERLVRIGVDSLKVEGRTKSLYYAARTAQVYRQAIDDAVAGRPFNVDLLGQLQGLANRGYTDGFYQRHHTQSHQNYMRGASEANRSQYVGDVLSVEDGWARVDVKNRFAVGDRLEVIHPGGNRDVALTRMLSDDGADISVAPGSGHIVRIALDASLDRALLARYL
ncbi:tRNA 5-hydroxyuridine modification protein YegQ [Pseudoduganella sp. FT25W]|jgi:putative protease|uniref:tRNA 5-hydroxyuridine modification protein YegQ n=1 Tax=Duganella alba TaxID=2666081 RepID=A0A6L5QMW1_9BURK|nr:tRNA 5-hydroxyuridine modification protein YegQ [Duganella alba]MRX10778.1 tRNA 5-hydroxyuridine modification protein YegQ [Duganella alba]MRX18897.1 tRNA 5-hydroxyuridine modification protein YegQ [Duganella alba]